MVKVAVDIDGVMADFATPANEWLADFLDVELLPVLRRDWWRDYPNGQRAWAAFWEFVERHGGWWLDLEAIEGSVEGVRKLLRLGHEPTFVTARNGRYEPLTRLWLDSWGLEEVPLVHARQKADTGHDVYFDDDPAQLLQVKQGVLFEHEWNRGSLWQGPRVATFGEAVRILGELDEQ